MFVRLKKTPNSSKTAIQLVENVRTGKVIKQKIVRHFGYALSEEEIGPLKQLALKYKLDLEQKQEPSFFTSDSLMADIVKGISKADNAPSPLPVNLCNLKEEKRIRVGIHTAYGSIFDQIGFRSILKNPSRKKASIALLRNMVMARIAQPASKLRSVDLLEKEYGINADVNAVYRMMDLVDDNAIDKMKQAAYLYTMGLLGEKINIIFYDCTTLYFESFTQDELKQNGYSKDGKFNQSQVLLAMMVTQAGLPVGYELFEGSTFEGNTLDIALQRLHQHYKIDKLIFVADSAMLSKDNIGKLMAGNQPFIVGARIKNLSATVTKEILKKESYQTLLEQKEASENVTYTEIALPPKELRLIVTYSPKRAAKDKHDRDKAIEQLTRLIGKSKSPKSLLNNYGYKKFVKVEGEASLLRDEEKILQSAAWDGLHGIITNIKEETVNQLLHHYKGLWQIEETFRISKHDLRMRPIFRWTPKRIKAHIAICFMALMCMRTMEYKVGLQYKKLSPAAIRNELMRLQTSILKDYTTMKEYIIPSKATQDAKKIYQVLGLKWSDTPFAVKKVKPPNKVKK
ncbi:MAG: IS1634 family transposase [Chitinophagaceae bacterium]